jgi:origin of replication binding protein
MASVEGKWAKVGGGLKGGLKAPCPVRKMMGTTVTSIMTNSPRKKPTVTTPVPRRRRVITSEPGRFGLSGDPTPPENRAASPFRYNPHVGLPKACTVTPEKKARHRGYLDAFLRCHAVRDPELRSNVTSMTGGRYWIPLGSMGVLLCKVCAELLNGGRVYLQEVFPEEKGQFFIDNDERLTEQQEAAVVAAYDSVLRLLFGADVLEHKMRLTNSAHPWKWKLYYHDVIVPKALARRVATWVQNSTGIPQDTNYSGARLVYARKKPGRCKDGCRKACLGVYRHGHPAKFLLHTDKPLTPTVFGVPDLRTLPVLAQNDPLYTELDHDALLEDATAVLDLITGDYAASSKNCWIVAGQLTSCAAENVDDWRELFLAFCRLWDDDRCATRENEAWMEAVWERASPQRPFCYAYLMWMAKTDSPAAYEQHRTTHRYPVPVVDTGETQAVPSYTLHPDFALCQRYLGSGVITASELDLFVRSPMGSGKSTAARAYIQSLPPSASVLVLSPRITFAFTIAQRFGFDNYKTVRNIACSHRAVVSTESLWRVEDRSYDVLIVDEVVSCLAQFSHATHKDNLPANLKAFERIVRSARRVLAFDAFLSDDSVDVFRLLGRKPVVVSNDVAAKKRRVRELPLERDGRRVDTRSIEALIEADLRADKPVYYVCTSEKKATAFAQHLRSVFPDRTIALYTGHEHFSDLKDVERTWARVDCLITTLTITVGVDFQARHFHRVYGFASNGCGRVRDLFQALLRVRNPVSDEVVLLVDPKIKSRYANHTRAAARAHVGFVKAYVSDFAVRQLVPVEYLGDAWIDALKVGNDVEARTSVYKYRAVLEGYLEFLGWSLEPYAGAEALVLGETLATVGFVPYHEIADIEYGRAMTLVNRLHKSESERHQLNKYFFKRRMVEDAPEPFKAELYEVYCKSRHTKAHLENVAVEKSRMSPRDLASLESIQVLAYARLRGCQLEIVQAVLESLGLESTYEGAVVERALLESIQVTRDAQRVFQLRDRSKGKVKEKGAATLKQNVGYVNSLLGAWSGSKLKAGKRKQKRAGTGCVDITPYELVPKYDAGYIKPKYNPFEERGDDGGVEVEDPMGVDELRSEYDPPTAETNDALFPHPRLKFRPESVTDLPQ